MMALVETLLFCLLAAACLICSRSDLRSGLVHNRVLVVFLAFAIALDAVYYGLFARDLIFSFLVNFALVAGVSLLMFYTHSFAGGDCKLAIILAMLFPARYYCVLWGTDITLVLAIAFALFSGYVFLLAGSMLSIVRKEVSVTWAYVKESSLAFFKVYAAALSYISLVGCIATLLGRYGFDVNIWAVRALSLVVALSVGRTQVLKRWTSFVPAACASVLISLVVGTPPVALNPESCALVLVLLVCQLAIKTSIYEEVEVEQLRRGMILTTVSSLLMQRSITKGLPGVSSEDLRSRLTDEEVESIKIWARATRTEKLAVVRKIPFAIFVSIGFLMYCVLWGVLAWS